jgi:hypothetical protein
MAFRYESCATSSATHGLSQAGGRAIDGAGTEEIFHPRSTAFHRGYAAISAIVATTGLLPLCSAILFIWKPKLLQPEGLEERLVLVIGVALWFCIGLSLLLMLVYASVSLYRSPVAETMVNVQGLLVFGSMAFIFVLYSASFEHSSTLQALKQLSYGLLMVVMSIAIVCAPWHVKLLKRAASTDRRLLWWLALLLPLILSLGSIGLLLHSAKVKMMKMSDRPSVILACYLLGLLLAWLALRIAARKQRKSPQETDRS